MKRVLSVLLSAAVALPGPAFAANLGAEGPVRPGAAAPRGPGAPNAAASLQGIPAISAIPSLPQTALPGVAVPGAAQAAAPSAAASESAAAFSVGPAATAPELAAALEAAKEAQGLSLSQTAAAIGVKLSLDAAFDNADAGPEAAKGKPEWTSTSARSKANRGSSPPKGPAPPSAQADDGGGPDYPARQVRFRGKLFRTTLFRPNTPVEAEIVRAIDAAQKSIHIALYEFKLASVLDALRRARARGVEIHIVLDYSNTFPQKEEGSDYTPKRSREIWALLREGFDVKILRGLSAYGINHNKFMVVDHGDTQSLAVFGSYNWSWSAETAHYENANITTDKARIGALKKYWDWLNSMAQPEAVALNYNWPTAVSPPPVDIEETISFNGVELPAMVLSPDSRPGRSIEARLVQAIDATRKTLDISVFALRSTLIAEALARAEKRGVAVRVIMDEGQSRSEPFGLYAQWLISQGVELKVLAGPDPGAEFQLNQKHHHKFAIFDGKLVETGSANYTKYAAQANFENAHFLDEEKDVASYAWIFERMFARAKAVTASNPAPTLPTDAQLDQEVRQSPRPAPERPPHPGPADPAIQPRWLTHNGKTLPSYAFRPDSEISPLIVQAIDSAQKTLRVAFYELNLPDVLDALRRAKKRKVKVEIVVDRSHVYTTGKDHTGQARKPSAEILALINEGFDVMTLKGEKSGIMHNKFVIVDAEKNGLVQWGSYNYARTAEQNHYENVMFSDDQHDVDDYVAYFAFMREHAMPIDRDKLDEVLSRGLDSTTEDSEDDELSPERAAGDPRDSKFPAPPQSTAPPIEFNGQQFRRHYFSPQGGILEAWINAINAAEKSVEIAMFAFYAREVAEALVARVAQAQAAGKTFSARVVLDAGQAALSKIDGTPIAQWLAERGVDVHLKAGPNDDGDPMFEKQHNKFMVIDGRLLFTGSLNLSPTAENFSFENENLTLDPTDVAGFVEYFARIFNLGWPPRAPKVPARAVTAVVPTYSGF